MTTPTHPFPFPYQAADPAEAVRLFFAQRVRASDPKMSGGTSTAQMHQRICDLVASAVEERLYVFWNDKPYGEKEEIEFAFKKIGENSDTYGLASPVPLVKDLEYRFRGVGIYLRGTAGGLAATGPGTYVLRVSPSLVTFAGQVVWSNQPNW